MLAKLSPSATRMIRMDHTHVLATFHKYRIDTPPEHKRALVNSICLALEVHAQLEEEIFYPAMRSVDPELVDKSVPEHNEMRRLIGILREKSPTDPSYDRTLMELMRDVMRHVADEETTLLPDAERVLADRLDDLGARMTRRRMELVAPRAGEIAVNTARAFPGVVLAIAGVLIIGSVVGVRALARPSAPALSAKALRRSLLPPAKRVKALAHKAARAVAA
jgi:hemerythrin superfamily protein